MLELLRQHRQALHKIPELGCALPRTYAYLYDVLKKLSCEILSVSESSLCAFFDGGKDQTVAFRADMDALPIAEAADVPFRSEIPNQMHACGHDGHMAMVLALAAYVNEVLAQLPHNVLLIFQPAEETTGGAKAICDSGILEELHVARIFGIHIWPNLPAGCIYSRANELMAMSGEVTIEITGKRAHISQAESGCDSLYAGVRFVRSVYEMVETELPKELFRLLKFGVFDSGTACNVISGKAILRGSLRTYSKDIFERIKNRMRQIADGIAEESGCSFSVDVGSGYPPVINDPLLFAEVCKKVSVPSVRILDKPVLAAEDFSFYGQKVPSVFFFLGTGESSALHSDSFRFDEQILLSGVALYQQLLQLK